MTATVYQVSIATRRCCAFGPHPVAATPTPASRGPWAAACQRPIMRAMITTRVKGQRAATLSAATS